MGRIVKGSFESSITLFANGLHAIIDSAYDPIAPFHMMFFVLCDGAKAMIDIDIRYARIG